MEILYDEQGYKVMEWMSSLIGEGFYGSKLFQDMKH